ncbi:MAG TPA: hypothetical protein VLL52_16840 [Anaerolineae bacterium]|nr:hypothetical protein [Anaerolineae bacterium]
MKQFIKFLMVMVMVLVGVVAWGSEAEAFQPIEPEGVTVKPKLRDWVYNDAGDHAVGFKVLYEGGFLIDSVALAAGSQSIFMTGSWVDDCLPMDGYNCKYILFYYDETKYTLNPLSQTFSVTVTWAGGVTATDEGMLSLYQSEIPSPDACGLTGCD